MIPEEYKNQSTVETKSRFIKSPYVLGPIFVEKETRGEALGYVLMALLIAILLERRIRNNLKKENIINCYPW
jgi:predicted GNAT family N-acyltransferase